MSTRGGSDIRLYDIFPDRYINGAYLDPSTTIWYPVQWNWDGSYGDVERALDLVNNIDKDKAA